MSLRRSMKIWDRLAHMDPMWAILSESGKTQNRWNAEEFFASGRREIGELLGAVVESGFPLRRGTALDFGCGIGRLTQALCEHFTACEGIDISASMIDLANRYNRHPEGCTYLHNPRPDLGCLAEDRYDFVYSAIALQHIEPQYAAQYIAEFVRVLAPGGLAIFQLPSERKATHRPEQFLGSLRAKLLLRSRAERLLRLLRFRRRPDDLIVMYGIPQAEVRAIITRAGGELIQVRDDDSAGENWISHQYWITKPLRRD